MTPATVLRSIRLAILQDYATVMALRTSGRQW
jgi:hypothetical protein